MPLIPAHARQRQADLSEFEASLVYKASSRTARAVYRNPVSKSKKEKKMHLFRSYYLKYGTNEFGPATVQTGQM